MLHVVPQPHGKTPLNRPLTISNLKLVKMSALIRTVQAGRLIGLNPTRRTPVKKSPI